MADRQNFTRAVAVEIAKRATRPDGQMACENCGAIGVKLELHHLTMDAMVLPEKKRAKRLTAADGALWCVPCHKPETAKQRKALARVEAAEARHLGVAQSRSPIASRPKPDKPPPRERAAGVPEIARRFGIQ